MKIVIENEEGQKVEFFAWKTFGTHIIKLSCECCDASDEVILDEHSIRTLREFVDLEGNGEEG